MVQETFFWRVMDDFITIGIIGGFCLLVYSKFRGHKSMKESWEEIKGFLTIGGGEEEQCQKQKN